MGIMKSKTRAREGEDDLGAKMLASYRGGQEGNNLVFLSRQLIKKKKITPGIPLLGTFSTQKSIRMDIKLHLRERLQHSHS